ncbi:ATP-binding cassette domain-containing protein [Candidatus Poribacteria bacterium]|nr:ATP-binding cassette domain-containing protein [Candidatus Poribacteria bacterium]
MKQPVSDQTLPIIPKEEMPRSIQEYVDRISGNGSKLQVAVFSDMNVEGDFEDCWFLATDEKIHVLNGNNFKTPKPIYELHISEIEEINLKNYVGNGILEVKIQGKALEILRFSKTAFRENQIDEIPRVVNRLMERYGKPSDKDKGHGRDFGHGRKDVRRCEKCGKIMRRGTCPDCLEKRTLLIRLFSYLKPYWYVAVIAFIISLATAGLGLIPQIITKYIMDTVFVPAVTALEIARKAGEPYVYDPQLLNRLTMLILAAIGVHLANTGLGTGRNYMMRWLGNKVIVDLRTSAYAYLQSLSLSFYNQKETGRLMSRISRDTERLQDFVVNSIQEFVMDMFMLVGMCVILFVTNWRLAALTLLPIPLITFASYIFGKKMHTVFHKVMRQMAGISAVLADTIPGVRVVKAFAAEDREVDRFNEENQGYFKTSMHAAKLSTIYFPIMGLATFVGGIVVQFFGGRSIVYGNMSMGDLTLFMGYLWRFYRPIRGLTRLNHMLQRSAAAAERVFEIIDAEPDVYDKEDAVELPTIKGDISFENVVFSYDGDKNALDGVSFEAEAGQMIGLSGPSGAGKTTLINLLGRFYDVTEGTIKVDDYDIRNVKMKSLREQIGVVLQEPFLFHGTIAQNIAYGRPNASRAEIVAAAIAANAHDFIMNFPDGYDTLVGERGARLSGGERQRISIARAILKNPRILILDEATSSVDTATESQIQAAIERLVKGRTTFAIAHRLSTLRKADKLLILEKGEIIEQGTHDELMDNDCLYKRLVDMQSELSKIKAV